MKTSANSRVILLLGLVVASLSSFCPEGDYLHPNEVAGNVCYKEGEEEILCDSNDDSLCTENNCLVQFGGYESYTCGHATHFYDNMGAGAHLVGYWTNTCCFQEAAATAGCLAEAELSFSGKCTYENVVSTAAAVGCTETDLFAYLGVGNVNMSRNKITELCVSATTNAHDSYFKFSDIAAGGYQFDREFMNGGSEWNNVFNPDLARVQWVEDNVSTKKGITFPENLYNFKLGDNGKCTSNAAMCCWTADSSEAGDGSCTDSAGCQDADPLDNTDVCYVNIEDSPLASHTSDGVVAYPADTEGNVNCMGFTWTDDEEDPSNLYKGNLLFEVAMRYGLKDNGYTRSVPHAPMCACVEQMPVVSKADCKDVEATSSWSFSPDAESGLLNLWQSAVDLIFNDCGGLDLAAEYLTTHNTTISHRITGECAATEKSFLASQGFGVQDSVKWVNVAGKGAYAEPDNDKHTEQFLDGTHTSYSRAEFEELWTSSKQILMRLCKYCTATHRYIYIRRYDDDGMPSDVDFLNMVKDNWAESENNKAHENFKLFSTYDDALQDKEAWKTIEFKYKDNIGFPINGGPDGEVHGQWNVWETPWYNKYYGQSSIAFYVATPV